MQTDRQRYAEQKSGETDLVEDAQFLSGLS